MKLFHKEIFRIIAYGHPQGVPVCCVRIELYGLIIKIQYNTVKKQKTHENLSFCFIYLI